jgi:hypothetical protein
MTSTTRTPYQPSAQTLLSWIEAFRDHAASPRWEDFNNPADAISAELKFAEARGLAIGLVEAGYVELPFAYTVREALNAAYRKATAELELGKA